MSALTKICIGCGEQPRSNFYKRSSAKDGLTPRCKICTKASSDRWYEINREQTKLKHREWYAANSAKVKISKINWQKANPEKVRDYHFKCLYGISASDYDRMLKYQCGLCAVCHRPETLLTKAGDIRSLAVDHNHDTNEVRGLLCNACNTAIGLLGDSIERVKASYEYLLKYAKI